MGGGNLNKMCNCSILHTYLFFFLFVCNHWEDCDKIWHAQLGSVEDSFKIKTLDLQISPYLSLSLFVLTAWPTGIRFGQEGSFLLPSFSHCDGHYQRRSNGARSSIVKNLAQPNLSIKSSTFCIG